MTESFDRQAPPPREVREAAIETLTTAYGEGQLTPEEYDERVAGVLAADNSWRLERWINDLQVARPPVPPAPRTSGWVALRRGWAKFPRPGKVALAALVLVTGSVWVGAVVHENTREDSSVAVAQGVTSGLADFRTAYEDEFGTTIVGEVQIDAEYVRAAEPVEQDPPRFQDWALQHGSFSKVGRVKSGRPGVVDLALVDVDAVEATLKEAVDELGVPEVSTVTTFVSPARNGTDERITLLIRNDFKESAQVTTDFAGREVFRRPFVEAGEG